jgi:outer membrane protein, heavy metal efflux system
MAISGLAPARRRSMVGWSLFWLTIAGIAGDHTLAAQMAAPASTNASLTLTALLQQVSARHPLIAAARAQVRSAEGSRRAAAVLPNPVFAYQLENVRLPGRDPLPMDREAMATATIPLEFIYQRGARVGQAKAELRAAGAEAQAQRQRLALEATRSYYETALAQVELSTARELASWLDSLVDYNHTRSREGVTAEADLIRSQLERDRAWAEVTMQEVKLAQARADLAGFLGDSAGPMSAPVGPTVTISDEPLPLPPAVASTSALLNRRPEVQAARERLSAASSGVGVARSLLVRQLGAMLGLKRTEGTSSLMAGVSLPIPIFDRNRGEVARARAERDLATAELANTERTVGAEIRGAMEGARLLTERAELLSGRHAGQPVGFLQRASDARRISVGAYREGAVPLLQVLDAARAWGEARATFYRTLFAQHESVVSLLAAQGTDLFTTIPTLSPQPESTRALRQGAPQ